MTERNATMDMLESSLTSFGDLFAGISETDWSVQSLCPDWDARGVLTHVAGIEHILEGWVPESAETPIPFERMGDFVAETADMEPAAVLERARSLFGRRIADIRAMSDETFNGPSATPVGPATYGRFMNIRIFDIWVHERDVATPLGIETDNSGPAAELSMDEVHNSLGFIVGKKVGLPEGMSIEITTTGGVERTMAVNVDGRATVVPSVDDPTVKLTADSLTFMQLACGRIDPQGAIDAGTISWSGDDEWGETAARNLRFTM